MSFPNMTEAFHDWETNVRFYKITKTLNDFEVSETSETEIFCGEFYPLSTQEIQFKPEGQRQWKWWALITEKLLVLDDIVRDEAKKEYRVMGTKDWGVAGFYEYELTESFVK
jgi:hypothetical protein